MHRRWVAASLLGKIVALAIFSFCPTLAVLCFVAPDLWLLYQLLLPSAQGLGPTYVRFATPRREVWLTIDDGPDERDTPRLLDLLDRHGARATFFLIGEKALRQPEAVREIERRGHEVAHHTHTHPRFSFWCAGPQRVRAELEQGLAALARGGARPHRFRPPVGIKNFFLQAALAEHHLDCVAWSVRAFDCADGRRAAAVAARVLRRIHPGAIILMHEGPSVPEAVRVEAIARVLEGLTAQGYTCVVPGAEALRRPGGCSAKIT
jgi:peptidoglycan/xylan/chitin deacetylase (PgdA/CDA1 family)